MSHHNSQLVLSAVRDVENERLAKAVCGLADGSLTVEVTGQSTTEVKGFVVNGDGKQYAVSLIAERAFCSCPDSMFRHSICKHCVALALHVLRTPHEELPRNYHTGDTVHKDGLAGKVVCVSGEFVSIRWQTGRITPMTREQVSL